MKKAFKKSLISTICMLVVGIVSLTGVTYAWFTQGNTAQVDGMQMSVVTSTGGLRVSEDANTWVSNLTLTDVKGINLNPVSTIGNKNNDWDFFTAEANKTIANKFTATADTRNYVKKVLYIENSNDAAITVALGGTETSTTIVAQTNAAKKGHLAARLGIQYEDIKSLTTGNVVGNAKICGKENGFGIFEPNALEHLDGTTSEAATLYYGVKAAGDFRTTDTSSTNGDVLGDVTTVTDAKDFTIEIPAQSFIQITVYLWLEGQDIDCTNAVGASDFKVNLCFELKVDAE